MPGPPHEYEAPGVDDVLLMVTLVAWQVMVPPVAPALGCAKLPSTVAVAVDVHWFGPVTVSVYVPTAVTDGSSCWELNPPELAHEKVVPLVVEPPFNEMDVTAQVKVPPVAVAFGAMVLPVRLVVVVEVQPFVPCTVSV